ncbi:MAG: hypothetical protein LW687_12265 [Burkholderiaceae bacterium]|nr:hypothetical protein [Burkholderiaceae bacterium]MCE2925924.1 hypothetical protein [Phycisphaeraceae bacterium]
MIYQNGGFRMATGLLTVSWTHTGNIKIKQDTYLDQDIIFVPLADWPKLRDAIDTAIRERHTQPIEGSK